MQLVHLVLVVLMAATMLFSIISLGLTAAERDGKGNAAFDATGSYLDTSTAFGLLGALMGMFGSSLGVFIFLQQPQGLSNIITKAWVAVGLLSIFFTSANFGIYAQWINYRGYIWYATDWSLEDANIAFHVLMIMTWIFCMGISYFGGVLGAEEGEAEEAYEPMVGTVDVGSGRRLGIGHIISGVCAVFFLITMALAGANHDKYDTPDTLAGLGVTGALFGMLTAVGGLLIPFVAGRSRILTTGWLLGALISFFLLSSAFGILAYSSHADPIKDTSQLMAELAFDIISLFFWSNAIFFYPTW